ncbi:hypothetical protein [Saccharibacillus qingshengii]|uniref:hypothetical protein n=1 Tax=Saccharibacillus qingshengii TaxID=1763540 RepID=UPI001555AB87|nr:hypothetical protein [Saccharibacillus qingshengii]
MQLPDSVYSAIQNLCRQGDDLQQAGDLESAKQSYISALRLLPGPHQEWEAADELTRAYMGGGIGIFMEDDPKYLAFVEKRIGI